MTAKYYVAIRPQTNEHHAVHKEGCPFLPDNKKRIYLGMFNSGQAALREGQRHFIKTKGCLFCLKAQIAHSEQPRLNKPVHRGFIPAELQISLWHSQNMLSCLN